MPFQYILANLLAYNDGAIAVIFLDETGETVDLACAESTPYQMKITGAYLGIYLRQMEACLDGAGVGPPKILHIEKDDQHFYAASLPDGYYLVLVQKSPGLVGRARATLLDACDELTREIFT